MTLEEKIAELNRQLGPIDPLTVDSIEDVKKRPKCDVSLDTLNKSAKKIRKSVIKFSYELESCS